MCVKASTKCVSENKSADSRFLTRGERKDPSDLRRHEKSHIIPSQGGGRARDAAGGSVWMRIRRRTIIKKEKKEEGEEGEEEALSHAELIICPSLMCVCD